MDKGIQLNVNLDILGVRHCQGRGFTAPNSKKPLFIKVAFLLLQNQWLRLLHSFKLNIKSLTTFH